jgi:hypothetical protein
MESSVYGLQKGSKYQSAIEGNCNLPGLLIFLWITRNEHSIKFMSQKTLLVYLLYNMIVDETIIQKSETETLRAEAKALRLENNYPRSAMVIMSAKNFKYHEKATRMQQALQKATCEVVKARQEAWRMDLLEKVLKLAHKSFLIRSGRTRPCLLSTKVFDCIENRTKGVHKCQICRMSAVKKTRQLVLRCHAEYWRYLYRNR